MAACVAAGTSSSSFGTYSTVSGSAYFVTVAKSASLSNSVVTEANSVVESTERSG